MIALTMRGRVVSHWNWQQPTERNHWSWSSTVTQEVATELNADQWSFGLWSQLKGEKAWEVDFSRAEQISKKKKLLFWSVMFSYSMQQQNISQWDCDMQQKVDFIRQPETTSSVAGLKRSSKALPKAKFEPKRSRSLFGGPLPVWPTTAFWIPAQPSHLRSMLSKSKRRTENCNTCSQHWSPERAQFSSTTTCTRMWHNQPALGLRGSASSTVLTWPLARRLPLQASQQLFAGKTLPQAAEAENGFQEVTEFHNMDFFLLELNTYSFLAKNVLIVMVPILINRDVFEPSYNDLKFRVQNHCSFCTNLIVKAKRI